MSKTQKLFDLIVYVNTKRHFTANDVAEEFGVSVRTAHRYLLELDEMGVPLYTETGRNGGYHILSNRLLPPIIFSEDEALAIFFSFQSMKNYKSLPFEVDIENASRKLFIGLPNDTKKQVENLKLTLMFWNRKRDIDTPLLKLIIQKAAQKTIIKIKYQSKHRVTIREIFPIGVYASEGIWYVPAYDYKNKEVRLFRADRILELEDSENDYMPCDMTLHEFLHSYRVKNPFHLHVKLSDKGVILCKDNQYFEADVCENIDHSGGYIKQILDYTDFDFVSRFFMTLGEEAEVIEPSEMRKHISDLAKSLVEQYK